MAAFKADNAKETAKGGKYTSQYDKEPATRPAHIPTTYNNNTIVYNPSQGGYGYWSGGGPGLGTWIMYDMLSDAAMISAMSHNHGYYHGPVYHNGSSGVGFTFFSIIMIMVIVATIVIVVGAAKRG